jgi:hypothetical protein
MHGGTMVLIEATINNLDRLSAMRGALDKL